MIGEIINDRYRLDSILGHGGLGMVYRSHDLQLERDVAIKFLNQVVFSQDERNQLFYEARLIAKLQHPNIISIHDVGEYNQAPFFVMDYVDRGSLRDNPPETFERKTKIIFQICAGLNYAHEKGVVHRDLKPENVLLDRQGRVKLVDFGIARTDTTRFNSDDQITGTANYMAPEIIKGETVDSRADLYSLGVIMYELYTGQLPFEAETLIGLINKHVFEEAIDPQEIKPGLPNDLNNLILRLLSKVPEDRPDSAKAVQQILEDSSGIRERKPRQIEDISSPTRADMHNLKAQTSSFIGRQGDLDRIRAKLGNGSCRLLTLVGIGGIGKTRLATQTAFELIGEFPDGVWMIELASLTEAALLPQQVARIFGVSAQEASEGQGETQVLVEYLKEKDLLLVIDNCEHLIEACAAFIEELLQGCPHLKALATSREDLRIPGENIYQVNPMDLPPDNASLDDYSAAEAIQLFVERARAGNQDFEINPANAGAIFQICHQLDGIPLAIELAAARIKLFKPEEIAARLDDRFSLLRTGSRTVLPRHQTLEAAMDWSYDLLNEGERRLLRRLGVFSAGFTLEAVEQVVEPKDDKQVEILEQLAQLVDKSLVMVDERKGAHRYKLLETVRQYGLKQLQEEGELESARNAHLHYFTQLAECQDPGLRSTQQIDSLAVLDADHDNLRRALRWALNSQIPDMAFRLIGALGWYWFMRGYWKESKVWLLESLENTQDLEPIFKAKAINRSGGLEIIRGMVAGRIELVEEALQICREHNDLEGMAWSLNLIGQAGTWGMRDLAIAGDNLSESIQLFTQIEDDWGIAWSTRYLGQIAELSGDFEKSISLQKEALEIFEQIGDHWNSAHSLYLMGGSYFAAGYFDEARAAYEQSLERCEQVEDKVMNAHAIRGLAQLAIHNNELDQAEHLAQEALEELKKFGDENCAAGALRLLGEIYRIQGDIDHAAIMFNESLDTFHSLGNLAPICLVLDRFAGLAVATGDYDEAVKLLAFVEENIGEFLKVSPTFEEEHKQLVSSAREMLGDHDFNQIWSEGLEMNLEAVILLAKKKNPQ